MTVLANKLPETNVKVYPTPELRLVVNNDCFEPTMSIIGKDGSLQADVRQMETGDIEASWTTEKDPRTVVSFLQRSLLQAGLMGQYGQYYPTASHAHSPTKAQQFLNMVDKATFDPSTHYYLGYVVDTSRLLPFQTALHAPSSLYTTRDAERTVVGIRFSDDNEKLLTLLADLFDQTAAPAVRPVAHYIVATAMRLVLPPTRY